MMVCHTTMFARSLDVICTPYILIWCGVSNAVGVAHPALGLEASHHPSGNGNQACKFSACAPHRHHHVASQAMTSMPWNPRHTLSLQQLLQPQTTRPQPKCKSRRCNKLCRRQASDMLAIKQRSLALQFQHMTVAAVTTCNSDIQKLPSPVLARDRRKAVSCTHVCPLYSGGQRHNNAAADAHSRTPSMTTAAATTVAGAPSRHEYCTLLHISAI
jgi:hypothetical protein